MKIISQKYEADYGYQIRGCLKICCSNFKRALLTNEHMTKDPGRDFFQAQYRIRTHRGEAFMCFNKDYRRGWEKTKGKSQKILYCVILTI